MPTLDLVRLGFLRWLLRFGLFRLLGLGGCFFLAGVGTALGLRLKGRIRAFFKTPADRAVLGQ